MCVRNEADECAGVRNASGSASMMSKSDGGVMMKMCGCNNADVQVWWCLHDDCRCADVQVWRSRCDAGVLLQV